MDTNVQRAEALLAAWVRGDIAAVGAFFAPDALVCMPFSPERRTGLAAVLDGIKDMDAAGVVWDEIQLDTVVRLDADRTATYYTSRYTRKDNRDFVTATSMIINTWEGGRVIEARFYEDHARLKDFLTYDRVKLTQAFGEGASKPDFVALGELYSPTTVTHPIDIPWGARAVGFEGIVASFNVFGDLCLRFTDFQSHSAATLGNFRTFLESSYRLINLRGEYLDVKLSNIMVWEGPRLREVFAFLDTAAINQFVASSQVDLVKLHRDHWAAVHGYDSLAAQAIFTDATVVGAIAGVPWGAECKGRQALSERAQALAASGVSVDPSVLDGVTALGTSNKTVDTYTVRFTKGFGKGAQFTLKASSTWTWGPNGRLASFEEYYDTSLVVKFLEGVDPAAK